MSEETNIKLTTWGVKVTDEVREKVKNALETSGLQGNDFLETMVSMYEANSLKNSQPILSPEITELETITRRIVNMYIGLGDRVKTILDDKERQYQISQEQDRETNKLLQLKIKELEEAKNELIEQQKEKVNSINDYITEVNQLTKLTKSNEALIEEYKQKNDNLTGLIGEYTQYKDTLQSIKTDEELREKELKDLQSKLIDSKNEIEFLKNTITEKELRHKEEIQNLKDRLNLDYEKQTLKLEKEYQAQIQSLRDEYNQKVMELLQQMQPQQEQEKKTKGVKA